MLYIAIHAYDGREIITCGMGILTPSKDVGVHPTSIDASPPPKDSKATITEASTMPITRDASFNIVIVLLSPLPVRTLINLDTV